MIAVIATIAEIELKSISAIVVAAIDTIAEIELKSISAIVAPDRWRVVSI